MSETARADFDAAISVLEETQVNVQGGSRLLRAIGPFVKGGDESAGLPKEQRARLGELSDKVQKELIREALYAGVIDRSDTVRAAGIRANIAVYGEEFAIEALMSLLPPKSIPDPVSAAFSTHGLAQVPLDFDQTFLAVFESFERNGLPFAAKKPSALGVETRGTILAAFWQVAISDLMFNDRVRFGAMRALNTVSGAQLDTLRFEEWDAWFRGVAPALEQELEALQKLEGATAAPGA